MPASPDATIPCMPSTVPCRAPLHALHARCTLAVPVGREHIPSPCDARVLMAYLRQLAPSRANTAQRCAFASALVSRDRAPRAACAIAVREPSCSLFQGRILAAPPWLYHHPPAVVVSPRRHAATRAVPPTPNCCCLCLAQCRGATPAWQAPHSAAKSRLPINTLTHGDGCCTAHRCM